MSRSTNISEKTIKVSSLALVVLMIYTLFSAVTTCEISKGNLCSSEEITVSYSELNESGCCSPGNITAHKDSDCCCSSSADLPDYEITLAKAASFEEMLLEFSADLLVPQPKFSFFLKNRERGSPSLILQNHTLPQFVTLQWRTIRINC